AVVVEGEGGGGASAAGGVGGTGERRGIGGEHVVEAGGRVSLRRVGRVREGDGRGAPLVHRAVVREGRGRRDVVDLDDGGVVGVAAVLVEDAAVDRVAAV